MFASVELNLRNDLRNVDTLDYTSCALPGSKKPSGCTSSAKGAVFFNGQPIPRGEVILDVELNRFTYQ